MHEYTDGSTIFLNNMEASQVEDTVKQCIDDLFDCYGSLLGKYQTDIPTTQKILLMLGTTVGALIVAELCAGITP